MAILVLQHSAFCGPGRFNVTLRDHGFKLDTRRLDLAPESGGDTVPTDLDNVHAILSLGGETNVGDQTRWMAEELNLLREAHKRQIPMLGVCLGAQLIAAALGGQVAPMESSEAGFQTVSLNPAGQTETLFAGIQWNSPQFCMHEQEVTQLPPGATLLASSKKCKVQAFKVGLRTYGVQYHPECDRPQVDEIAKDSGATLQKAGLSLQQFNEQTEASYATFARLADRLAVNFAAFCLPPAKKLTA